MLAEYEVFRRTMPISSAIEVSRWRNSSSSMAWLALINDSPQREWENSPPFPSSGPHRVRVNKLHEEHRRARASHFDSADGRPSDEAAYCSLPSTPSSRRPSCLR